MKYKSILSFIFLLAFSNASFTQGQGHDSSSDLKTSTLKSETHLIPDTIFKKGRQAHRFSNNKYHYLTGNFTRLSFGGYLNSSPVISISAAYGKRVFPNLSAGLGASLTQIVTNDRLITFSFVTPQLFIRQYLSKLSRPARIYLTLNGGYSFTAEKPRQKLLAYAGGPSLGGALGLQWSSRSKTKLSVEVGYLYQPSEATFLVSSDTGPPGRLIEKRTIWRNILTLSAAIN